MESAEEVEDEDDGDGEGGREGGKKRGKTKERRVSSPRGYLTMEVISVARRRKERNREETKRFASSSREREA